MPSSSPTGPRTRMSTYAVLMVDRLATAYLAAQVEAGEVSAASMSNHWPDLPLGEFADLFTDAAMKKFTAAQRADFKERIGAWTCRTYQNVQASDTLVYDPTRSAIDNAMRFIYGFVIVMEMAAFRCFYDTVPKRSWHTKTGIDHTRSIQNTRSFLDLLLHYGEGYMRDRLRRMQNGVTLVKASPWDRTSW